MNCFETNKTKNEKQHVRLEDMAPILKSNARQQTSVDILDQSHKSTNNNQEIVIDQKRYCRSLGTNAISLYRRYSSKHQDTRGYGSHNMCRTSMSKMTKDNFIPEDSTKVDEILKRSIGG